MNSHFSDLKDITASLQSIAIVLATLLGGGWALFQFFSLRAREKANFDLEKAKKDLVEEAVIVIELTTEVFEITDSYFLHVRVIMKNVGNGAEVLDWTQAGMQARRFYKTDELTLAAEDRVLQAWPPAGISMGVTRLEPEFSDSRSFLIPISQVGVYSIAFSILASTQVANQTVDAVKSKGRTIEAGSIVFWSANKFVSVTAARANVAMRNEIGQTAVVAKEEPGLKPAIAAPPVASLESP